VAADPFELTVEDVPDPEHVGQLVAGLTAYNTSQAGPANHRPLAVFLHVNDRIAGGADGYTHWRWLFVSHLWVDGTRRGQGAGRQVLAMMEDAARGRGCQAAWLDTYSFQARGFYQGLGYQQFGELRDYPPRPRPVLSLEAAG
jgi:GNAT superfamily N-acetyltransferase